jgi:hypothetical protein
MQLEYVFQNPIVIVVVLFGMSCTMGLSLIVPVVANVILAVFSGWASDMGESVAKGTPRNSAFPDERENFPKQVIGYPPDAVREEEAAPAPLVVEADEVDVVMLTKLGLALTVVTAVMCLFGLELFKYTVAQEYARKGYSEQIEVIPHVSAE